MALGKRKKIVIAVLLSLMVVAVCAAFLYKSGVSVKEVRHVYRHYYNLFNSSMVNYINSFGKLGILAFIGLFTARTLLIIFPYSLMVIIGGSLFGIKLGFLYSLISVFTSSTLAFFLSRLLGKEFVQKILRGKFKELDNKVEQHGFKIILLMRISALFPFDVLSYAAGLTKIKYRDFILGTVLGIILETFSLTFLGYNLKNPFSRNFKVAIILIILTILVPFLYTRIRKKPLKADEAVVNKESTREENNKKSS